MIFSKITLNYILVLSLALGMLSCRDNDSKTKNVGSPDSNTLTVPKESELILISDTLFNGNSYSVYADSKLDDKYHTIYLNVKDRDGKPVNDNMLDFYPEMHMGQMKHGGPFEHPVAIGEGWYTANMVFIMADILDMGKGWELHTIIGEGVNKDTLAIKLPVSQAKTMRTMSSGTRDDSRVFISNLLPDTVKQGRHPIKFLMSKMEHHHFPVLDGYVIKFTTKMPSMGHGSTGNKNAESIGKGYYEGLINFTMAGPWEILVELWKDGKKANQDDIKYLVQVTN